MLRRYMGKTGLRVSELCLGAMTFGRETSEDVSHEMLDIFSEAGGIFIDTANVYGAGESEEILGRWLENKRRDDYVIATKVRFGMGNGPNDVGLSRKHILKEVEASLRRLGTDYIDLYQIHCWDVGTPLEETLSALNALVRTGKVRYIGASNLSGWQLQRALDVSRESGWEPFTCLQPQYSLLCRSTEWELIPVCIHEGLGVIPWSPLRGGWLTGKYHQKMKAPPEGSRAQRGEEKGWTSGWSRNDNEFTWRVIDALRAVAIEAGKSPAQVAINWLLQQPSVTAPIIGARDINQLENNLGAAGWALSEEQVARLSEVSTPTKPYPYDFIESAQQGR
ncbi:MAG: aldo/keto reductase [Anaerolineales bacterium]